MDSRYPPPEAHNVVNGLKNAFAIYAYIASAFALGWVAGWLT